jgi:nitrogen fixation protein FixH
MALSDLTARTHPRSSGIVTQVLVLLASVAVGIAIGLVLLVADQRSWSGAVTQTATVTGVDAKGIAAEAAGRTVSLHVAPIPRVGTKIRVEVSPDGRARPYSYRQTALKATRSGVALSVLLALLVQVYRYAVTRRTT